LAQRDLEVDLTDAACDYLVEVGYDPAYGARPLKRALQQYIMEPLSEQIIGGEVAPGDKIVVDRTQDGLTFTRRQLAAA